MNGGVVGPAAVSPKLTTLYMRQQEVGEGGGGRGEVGLKHCNGQRKQTIIVYTLWDLDWLYSDLIYDVRQTG